MTLLLKTIHRRCHKQFGGTKRVALNMHVLMDKRLRVVTGHNYDQGTLMTTSSNGLWAWLV